MEREYYEGPAFSVSAKNSVGPFDVLPGHANMVAILTHCDVIIATPEGDKRIPITNGILKVSNNGIKLFIDL